MNQILEKQKEREAKILNFRAPNKSTTQRNNKILKSKIDILDDAKREKYLQLLQEKEERYWEKKKHEKLRLRRFK